jgi:hypothetical protein
MKANRRLDGAISASCERAGQTFVSKRRKDVEGEGTRTADELSGMILSALAVKDVAVRVRKDHAYGWQPIVVASPGI